MKTVELFAGAGGLGVGVASAGFETVAVIERDPHCCSTIRANQSRDFDPVTHWPLFEGDIKEFDFRALGDSVDLVSGGPPCQPFSLGGKHRGHRDDRDMFPQAIRAVRELRPRAFLFENVKGLTRRAFANYFEYIRLQLMYPDVHRQPRQDWTDHLARLEQHHTLGRNRGLHYNVLTRVLNAADFGVPQRRERVFFVGFRDDLSVDWSFPEPTHSLGALLWSQHQSGEYWERHRIRRPPRAPTSRGSSIVWEAELRLEPWRTVRDVLFDLPDPELDPYASFLYENHRFQPGARSYPGHTGSPLDEPAKTIKAGDHGVPGGENMLRRPNGSVRYFSVRESARLQTFADSFVLRGSWTESMRQLGNAVPVDLARHLGTAIRDHLAAGAPPS